VRGDFYLDVPVTIGYGGREVVANTAESVVYDGGICIVSFGYIDAREEMGKIRIFRILKKIPDRFFE
jgi:hypothetical protein